MQHSRKPILSSFSNGIIGAFFKSIDHGCNSECIGLFSYGHFIKKIAIENYLKIIEKKNNNQELILKQKFL